jgi:hypothetical protein
MDLDQIDLKIPAPSKPGRTFKLGLSLDQSYGLETMPKASKRRIKFYGASKE